MWTPVEQGLPRPGERVLISTKYFVGEGFMTSKCMWVRYEYAVEDWLEGEVAAWQPMPEAYVPDK